MNHLASQVFPQPMQIMFALRWLVSVTVGNFYLTAIIRKRDLTVD